MQDGSTHVRSVVNSGEPLTVGGRDWKAKRECDLNVVCIFFLGQSFPKKDLCFISSRIFIFFPLLMNPSIKFC